MRTIVIVNEVCSLYKKKLFTLFWPMQCFKCILECSNIVHQNDYLGHSHLVKETEMMGLAKKWPEHHDLNALKQHSKHLGGKTEL